MHSITHQTTYYLLDQPMCLQFEIEIYALSYEVDPYNCEPGAGADFLITEICEWIDKPWNKDRPTLLTGAQAKFLTDFFWDEICDHVAQYSREH